MKEAHAFNSFDEFREAFSKAVRELATSSPLLRKRCMIHGTGAASSLYLKHRPSWDIDLVTIDRDDLCTFEIAEQLSSKFGKRFKYSGDSMIFGTFEPQGLPPIDVQIIPFCFDIEPDFEISDMFGMKTESLSMYAQLKAVASFERRAPKDIYDLAACFNNPLSNGITKAAIAREGRKGALLLDRAVMSVEVDQFATRKPGFEPVWEHQIENLANYAHDRARRYKLIEKARREEMAFSL